MNQRDFALFYRKYENMFRRYSNGAASRSNSNETITHFLKKSEVWFKLKHRIPSELLDEGETPKWYYPHVFTEVEIGKKCFDVIALTLSGAFVFEIISSETEKSIKIKERSAVNLGFKFVAIYC
jgi:hypothetical protein